MIQPDPTPVLHTPTLLTLQNWSRGFLMDAEWMAGVSENEQGSSRRWKAWVVSLAEGSLIAETNFDNLEEALTALNRIPGRNWSYEPTKTCSGEKCGPDQCKGEGCKIFKPKTALQEAQCTPCS